MVKELTVWERQVNEASPYLRKTIEDKQAVIELGFAIQIIQNSSTLQTAQPQSIYNAIINIGRCGITLNPALKLAYLVPRDGKCVLDISYMGLREILIRAGAVLSLEAFIVYEDDIDFEMEQGTNAYIKHVPRFRDILTWEQQKKRVRLGCYTIATLNNGVKSFEWMSAGEILGIKEKASKGGNTTYSPWKIPEYEGEMWKKTVLRRHSKAFPKMMLPEYAKAALEIDAENAKMEQAKADNTAFLEQEIFGVDNGKVIEGEVQDVQ